MQNDRSFSATRVLYDIAHALDSDEEPDTRVRRVVEWLRLIVPYERCALLVALPGRDQLFFESPQSSEAEPVDLREVLVGVLSLLSEQGLPERQSLALDRTFGYASHLAVPLVGFDHHFGLLFVGSTLPDAYTEEHLKLLSVVASQVAAYLSKLRLVEILTARSLELEAANQSKDEFLATLSHELRSPLTAIVGWTKLLRAGRLDEAATAHALEVIDRNAKHQAKLIEDILDMSRIITGKLRLDFQPVDLSRVIGAGLESVRLMAEAKEIRITVLSQSTGLVLGDSSRLQQMVRNLLTNALKFTHRGGRVEVCLDREGSRLRLHVVDNGAGIRLDFLPHIFEPFRQADGSISRKHGGLGLGLALVRHLAELHQGKVWAESAGEGRGATFTVDLPVLAARDEELAVITGGKIRETQGDIVPSSAELKGRSILIVDDDIDSLEMLTEILRQSGADVLTATSAGEAYELVQRERPDVLVTDVGMPEEDGYALLRKVRELAPECGGSIPAVALTGYASEEDRRQAILRGFQPHLSKPVEPTQLLTIVANLIQSDRLGERRGKGC
jgi:signal transduction histidine kinase/ActR/RegA family two-component response regulator